MAKPGAFHWTYEEYVRRTVEGEYFEIIDGEAYVNPVPTSWHQSASRNLEFLLMLFLRGKDLGILHHAPFDVVFADDVLLQPDIVVIAKQNVPMVKKAGLFGAPDFIVEVLSPSTESRDRNEKLAVYARFGVREYWLVDPELLRIEVFVLESGRLVLKATHDSGDARSLAVLPGFTAPLAEVFARP